MFKATNQGRKGFSLMSAIVSVGSFAVFAILIQNVLLMGHSFRLSQKNLLDTFQISQMIRQKLCMANSAFRMIHINQGQTYSKAHTTLQSPSPATPSGDDPPPPEPAVQYQKHLNGQTSPTPFITLKLSEDDSKAVSQDSHTVVILKSDGASLAKTVSPGESADFLSGYIFASRCVRNEVGVVKTSSSGGVRATFEASSPNAAKDILDLEYRPFAFPNNPDNEDILCCPVDASHNNANPGSPAPTTPADNHPLTGDSDKCKSAIQEYVPRIYVIHLVKSSAGAGSGAPSTPPSSSPFYGKVVGIQELPELQDMDNLWGAGFMLSMDKKVPFSPTRFQLDLFTFKNTCSSSAGHVQKCPLLALGTNPKDQKLKGIESSGINMLSMIHKEKQTCSGYSANMDSASSIAL